MECEICHQRPASLHVTNYVEGNKEQLHICHQCAVDEGYVEAEQAYQIHDLLSGLFNVSHSVKQQRQERNKEAVACPTCRMTYQDFVKTGKFGCSDCYQAFDAQLDPLLRRVHSGNTVHVGKVPHRQHEHLKQKQLIQAYRAQLNQLIEEERFEEAATLRDKIRAIKDRPPGDMKEAD